MDSDKKSKVDRNYCCVNALIGGFIVWLAITVFCGVMVYQASKDASYSQSAQIYQKSGQLHQTPFAHYLDSTGSALAMVVENDLSGRVGRIYRIWSRTAQPHTVTILNGAHTTTWDGINKKAMIGGAIGDGFVFEVIDKDKIVVHFVTNTQFG